jgi:hypothetical protein
MFNTHKIAYYRRKYLTWKDRLIRRRAQMEQSVQQAAIIPSSQNGTSVPTAVGSESYRSANAPAVAVNRKQPKTTFKEAGEQPTLS